MLQGLLALVGLWMMGYWFGFKQKMYVSKKEVTSESVSSSPSLSRVEKKDLTMSDTANADNTKHNVSEITHESKQVQVDLTHPAPSIPSPSIPPISPISSSPALPSSTPPPCTTDVPYSSPEILAREERRRKRDERRAARAHNPQPEVAYKSPTEYLEDRCQLNIHTYHPYDRKKKCLVLDIDYTIFDHKSDFDLALEFKRPYLHEFLKICGAYYNIVIWSATAYFHIQTKMEKLQLFNHPDFQICFVLSKDHMIPHGFSIKRKTYFQDIKPLSLLWMKFPDIFTPENTIHIDDVEENFVLNPSNGLRIEPFREALLFRQTDRELFYLAQYLTIIADMPSFSSLNHNKWKDYIINTLWNLQTVLSLPIFTTPDPPTSHLLEHHHQSLIIKQKIKERAKEHEREERVNRHIEEEKRKALALSDANAALEELEKSNNMNINNNANNSNNTTANNNSNNTFYNNKKEATEDELMKLAKEAMERKTNNKNNSSLSPPRSPSIKTPPRSPSSVRNSPKRSPSSPSVPSSLSPSPSLSLSHSPSTPSMSFNSLSPSPLKSPARKNSNGNQFLAIPSSFQNFPTAQPSLSLAPSPPRERRIITKIEENNDNNTNNRENLVRGIRLEIINNNNHHSSLSSPSDFLSFPLPISPIAHAAN